MPSPLTKHAGERAGIEGVLQFQKKTLPSRKLKKFERMQDFKKAIVPLQNYRSLLSES